VRGNKIYIGYARAWNTLLTGPLHPRCGGTPPVPMVSRFVQTFKRH